MKSDQIYIYPTDTVWGIGCSLYSERGFQEIARIKRTSAFKPLSIMYADIDDFKKSFNFPDKVTKEWLAYFFMQESTLLIPAKWAKINIPEWSQMGSDYISLRCLNTDSIKNLYQKIGNPFYTTSLNLQGEPPILTETEAEKFAINYCPDAIFQQGTGDIMSGLSSTMIFLNDNLDFRVQREGRKVNELLIHLNQLRLA